MSRVFSLSLIVGLTLSGASWADVSTADVNIVSVQGALTNNGLACTAVINNQNDDDSRGTKVIMLMPLQVKILRMSVSGGRGTCTKAPLLGGYNEYAICDLGQLPQGSQCAPHRRGDLDTFDRRAQLSAYLQRVHLQRCGRYSEEQQLHGCRTRALR